MPAGSTAASWKAEDVVRLGKAREQSVVEHRPGAFAGFLAGLQHHHQGAGPLMLHRGQPARGAEPGRDMRVVAAGMHNAGLNALGGGRPDLGGERQARLFGHRQGVHVRAEHQHRPGPVLHHRDHAGLPDLLGDLEAELAHLRRRASPGSGPPASTARGWRGGRDRAPSVSACPRGSASDSAAAFGGGR